MKHDETFNCVRLLLSRLFRSSHSPVAAEATCPSSRQGAIFGDWFSAMYQPVHDELLRNLEKMYPFYMRNGLHGRPSHPLLV